MIVQQDIARATASLLPVWRRLDGARIFMTGGTGFIGRWMLELLAQSPARIDMVLLTRDPQGFAARAPHLASRFTMVEGAIADFTPPDHAFSHIIHGATDASAQLTAENPRLMFDTIVAGTRRVLDMACGLARPRMLFMSSGAVYGIQPPTIAHVAEDWTGGPDPRDPRSAYAEGKRAAETLCAIYGKQFGLDIVTARIFALLGPLLPLDTHFAAGNFIRDAMAGRTIVIEGDGRPVRSYLYAADLAVWLWTMLADAPSGSAYNCGSEEAVSIRDLAARVAHVLNGPGYEVRGRPDPGWNPGRYVPSTAAIRTELGLTAPVPLEEAIRRTALANGWKPCPA